MCPAPDHSGLDTEVIPSDDHPARRSEARLIGCGLRIDPKDTRTTPSSLGKHRGGTEKTSERVVENGPRVRCDKGRRCNFLTVPGWPSTTIWTSLASNRSGGEAVRMSENLIGCASAWRHKVAPYRYSERPGLIVVVLSTPIHR